MAGAVAALSSSASSLLKLSLITRRWASSSSAAAAAKKLLDASGVKGGQVLVQNEADGETARALIDEAKSRGITTVNVIADKPGTADIIEGLKHGGADIVVTESYCNTWYAQRLLSDLPPPSVGILHNPSGSHATAVARLLGKGSTLLTYGGGKLPSTVEYGGAERKSKKWAEYLKEKGVSAKAV